MGSEVEGADYTDEDRARFTERVEDCLGVLDEMLATDTFEHAHPRAGMEVEIYLVGADGRPSMSNVDVLAAIDDKAFVSELCRFNIELNLTPRHLGPGGILTFEHVVRSSLNDAAARAEPLDVGLAAIGVLPTATPADVTSETLTPNPRYAMLDTYMRWLRGAPFEIVIDGPEPLRVSSDSIAPEALCTSMQIHLQVSPADFPGYWNASQAIAGVQLALGANSPYVFGHRWYAESRIPLFGQATDTRTPDERAADVTPRVFFGDDWIGSPMDLFRANMRYSPLLPEVSAQDPRAARAAGEVPDLAELTLHNGTIYRWNRPVYDHTPPGPHLRIENRVLPAGPTAVDMMANVALYAGLTRELAERAAELWPDEPFDWARRNFEAGVRDGIDATLSWPGVGERPARELVPEVLLPRAAAGLAAYGVDAENIAHYLGVIEGRCATGQNGAAWQTAEVAAREDAGMSRDEALAGMVRAYLLRMHRNQPVHTWPVFPASEEEPV
ncbi:glutamate--cysteine ligase [Naumannella cuiyingiana]|uniref:Gamma-glutamyl:cysteine ligase YbdK (ATP-grasp superfamily) n=1 Tax=Naumannella cuiyingiana TaxID=1347891 RepID=A0A7Z0D9J5_9ACTN|nr:glutamate--cysteine ligase [Naumannella cuiyingiana]NYI71188.1 gamma-glutamyl:cysteine ligase YbdK (ATP-grasp superfamily) [Naumannella cuiyingiana]